MEGVGKLQVYAEFSMEQSIIQGDRVHCGRDENSKVATLGLARYAHS